MKKTLTALSAFMMTLFFTACGNAAETPPPATTPVTPVPGTEATAAPFRVGISMPNRSAQRWVIEGEHMRDLLLERGFEVDLQFADDQAPTQVNQLENMLTAGVDLLIITPIDGSALTMPLATAGSMGVPVISYVRLLMNSVYVDYYIAFDPFAIGVMQGQNLMDAIGAAQASPDNPLFIELFTGSLDDSNTPFYFDGSMLSIQPYIDAGKVVVRSGQDQMSQVAIQGWDGLLSQSRMQNLLSAHYTDADLAGVLSPYDGMSIGIISALQSVGYTTLPDNLPIVTGLDAELPSLVSIWRNEQYSTVFLDLHYLASSAVVMAEYIARGETPSIINDLDTYHNGVRYVPSYVAEATLLTRENLWEVIVEGGIFTAEEITG